MSGIALIQLGLALMALSGVPGLFLKPGSKAGRGLASAAMAGGSALGLWGMALSLSAPAATQVMAWALPLGSWSVALDPLGAFFLGLVLVVPTLASIYGLGYWREAEHPGSSRRLGLSYGLLAASMGLVVLARDSVLFLLAWEIMALSAWFAATAEGDRPEVRRAGWIYLVATHVGTLLLFGMFALLRKASGSFALSALAGLDPSLAAPLFLLCLLGFGFKAGFVPLHVWLPGAHANAPSHVSAVMSGVMLKMGIYGIVRITSLMPRIEAWMGASLLCLGALTGIAGIGLALGQKDLKRSLAYSSIENIGIIGMGLGLGLLGRSLGRVDLVLLGLGGSLLHVWNHGLFKSLLFMNAGAIIHATGTRDIDRMGGLGKRMPLTAALFILGAVAIAGLPPLNGFASEWLLYLGLFSSLGGGMAGTEAAAVGAVALAAIGALALACFVRLLSAVFLGEARSTPPTEAHDPGPAMGLPMIALAAGCLFLGLGPMLASPLIEDAASLWAAEAGTMPALPELAPQAWITVLGLALLAAAALLLLVLGAKAARARRQGTWDCGYAAPTARMEYTASSFGDSILGLFSFFLLPSRKAPRIEGAFPRASSYAGKLPDPVLDRAILPLARLARRRLKEIRVLQQGQVQLYILYILVIAIILLFAGGLGV